ncbi:hypothetical protein KAR91_30850 [Candidatus Pacearchaeota archaeon]|nr:hypothetical protein [Candidatus Pacearchaeota archaeon]
MEDRTPEETINVFYIALNKRFQGKKLDEVELSTFHGALGDLTVNQLNHGFSRFFKEHTDSFPPTTGKLREYCLTNQGETIEDEARQAFRDIYGKGVSSNNCFFQNPVSAETVRQIGSRTIDGWLEKDRAWHEKDFIKTYIVLKKRGGDYDRVLLNANGVSMLRIIGNLDKLGGMEYKLLCQKARTFAKLGLSIDSKPLLEGPKAKKIDPKKGFEKILKGIKGIK